VLGSAFKTISDMDVDARAYMDVFTAFLKADPNTCPRGASRLRIQSKDQKKAPLLRGSSFLHQALLLFLSFFLFFATPDQRNVSCYSTSTPIFVGGTHYRMLSSRPLPLRLHPRFSALPHRRGNE
jgi:hypothetical protein